MRNQTAGLWAQIKGFEFLQKAALINVFNSNTE